MYVSALHVYPFKSARGLSPTAAVVEPWGLAGDRRWMLVDGEGVLVSAREAPRLFEIAPIPEPGGALRLEGPHAGPLRLVPNGEASPIPVNVHGNQLLAIPIGPDADAWFARLLGRDDVRVVWMDDPATRRPTNPAFSEPTDRVSFADGYPLLLTCTASLERLNEWIAATAGEGGEAAPPLSMRRFRPNLTVDGAEPFAEDGWKRVRVGAVEFRLVKPCERCVMTTIDPDTLAQGKEPLRTLARHRKWEGKTWFGMNIIPDNRGELRVGDVVEVLA